MSDQNQPHSTLSRFRYCEDCDTIKPLADFASAGDVNGVKYHRYRCIPCYSKFKLARKERQRQRFFDYRKTLQCKHCGNPDWRVIEFHHRDPSQKDRAVSDMMGWSWEKIEKEIAKCDALCANCHRILHYELREAKKAAIIAG